LSSFTGKKGHRHSLPLTAEANEGPTRGSLNECLRGVIEKESKRGTVRRGKYRGDSTPQFLFV